MPSFKHTLIIIGSIYDADCTVSFTKQSVVVYYPQQRPLIKGRREPHGTKLWRIAIIPSPSNISTPHTGTTGASLQEYSDYDLPGVKALVQYFHAAAGFPVRDIWLQAIKCVNYYSWPGLTYTNDARYCQSSDKTIMGHLIQYIQGVISTKPK